MITDSVTWVVWAFFGFSVVALLAVIAWNLWLIAEELRVRRALRDLEAYQRRGDCGCGK